MQNQTVKIEDAATLILVQDSADGPRVLMQQRHPGAAFVGGAWVFPGGKVDQADHASAWLERVDITNDRANRLLGVDEGGLAFWIAALRETTEEAGLLLATQNGNPINGALATASQRLLQQKPEHFLTLCQQHQLTLLTDSVRYLSRWITPEGSPKRYDTRFFLAAAPPNQTPEQDTHEVINTCWVTPEQALHQFQNDDWMMVLPTIVTLRQLCGFENVDSLLHRLGNHIDAKSG